MSSGVAEVDAGGDAGMDPKKQVREQVVELNWSENARGPSVEHILSGSRRKTLFSGDQSKS
jgi:hypothetical protein